MMREGKECSTCIFKGEKYISTVITIYNCVQERTKPTKISQKNLGFAANNFAATPRIQSSAIHFAVHYVSCKRSNNRKVTWVFWKRVYCALGKADYLGSNTWISCEDRQTCRDNINMELMTLKGKG